VLCGTLATLGADACNIEGLTAKSDSTYAMIRDLLPRGVHGIGFQAHWIAGNLPARDVMPANFARFACEMVVLRGFTDRDSWIPGTFPGSG
jgi:GH35 family endo-1,4-beta-xylanase